MSKASNVGNSQTYGNDDQRTYSDAEKNEADRYREGKANSHQANDAKDERTIANKLEREEHRKKEEDTPDIEQQRLEKDATLPARAHGNEPSKGAKIDQEIREEEEAILKKKGAFGPAASN